MPERHVMIDLETMGTAPNAAIIQIGAVSFDPLREEETRRAFHVYVDLADCQHLGLTLDAATIEWWMQQDEQARQAAFGPRSLRRSLMAGLSALGDWLYTEFSLGGGISPVVPALWAHGAAFDPPIMESAYRAIRQAPSWGYRAIRDTRTLAWLVGGFDDVTYGTPHVAVDDAHAQAIQVQRAMRRLQGYTTFPLPRRT